MSQIDRNRVKDDDGGAPNPARRKLLVTATSVVGAAGLTATAAPFIASMNPSERARAGGAPVDAEFSRLDAGIPHTAEWRGKPVWIVRRTEAMVTAMQDPAHLARLADPASAVIAQQPAYAHNAYRSIKPQVLVVVPICTHLGCVPTFRADVAPADLGPDWPGGFFCPCHGSKFDLAGRVYRNVPAPTNLVIPPYHYLSAATVRIGEDPESAKS
jgi:ubiquinol-cytochrome c reductase iron-sulfur subunit